MYLLESDPAREMLRMTYTGHVTEDEAKQCRNEIEGLLPQLTSGFRILTDLTDLERMDFACTPQISEIMDLCRQHGVRQVVRVIPDPGKDIGFSILSFFHYGADVEIQTCESMSDARKALSLDVGC